MTRLDATTTAQGATLGGEVSVILTLALATVVLVAGTTAFALAARRGTRDGALVQSLAVLLLAVGVGSAGVLLTPPPTTGSVAVAPR